jgi:pimeloyl-ACP methyl ester carboxylesterase
MSVRFSAAGLLRLAVVILATTMVQCGYVRMVTHRQQLKQTMREEPSQTVKRELYNETNCILYGKVQSLVSVKSFIAVVAVSYKYGKMEVVASSFLCGNGYYSLVVPPGQYQIFAFLDVNHDNVFSSSECVGYYQEPGQPVPFLSVSPQEGGFSIKKADIYIVLSAPFIIDQPISIPLPSAYTCKQSLTYPTEVLRSLDDTLFSPEVSKLGVYYPAKFTALSGLYFYALEERNINKTPVLFVHGYGGTPREFAVLAASLDTSRYQPFFFHYPSGQSIDRTARIFYEIIFSGRIVDLHNRRIVIIAHSMGGLVARAAINYYSTLNKSPVPVDYISLCTPYGGVEAAAHSVEQAPEVVSSWREIAAGSSFICKLHSIKLAENARFFLFFGYRNPGTVHVSENSDGTILLSSQLYAPVQNIASGTYGFNESHESILTSPEVCARIKTILGK